MFILSIIILIIILITYSCQLVGWHKECRGKLEQSRSSQHLAQPSSKTNILNQDTLIVVMKKVLKKHYRQGGGYWAYLECINPSVKQAGSFGIVTNKDPVPKLSWC